jgi:hypothetical protein
MSRAEFESAFPVPDDIVYLAKRNRYAPKNGKMYTGMKEKLARYNNLWKGWQAAINNMSKHEN